MNPLRPGELLALLGLVVLCDLTIYRGQGFAGISALLLLAPPLLLLGSVRLHRSRVGREDRSSTGTLLLICLMLIVLAGRLIWCGSNLAVASGFIVLVAFATATAGLRPYVAETVAFGAQTLPAGYHGLLGYAQSVRRMGRIVPAFWWLNFLLPMLAFFLFGSLFVLANPDLASFFGDGFQSLVEHLRQWARHAAPSPLEILFWALVLWLSVGLLRPLATRTRTTQIAEETGSADGSAKRQRDPVYGAYRNTLLTVIALFAVYLIFEFKTLWLRTFPEGFHYSGYAHEGAFWLTVALALATVVLSVVFRGRLLQDPRLTMLRRLAWLWSLENLLLAMAVYHRLLIYIGFNGLTRMRIIGLFGVSTVVAGFLLVVWKIARNRNFIWLVRRQLWALAFSIYLFAVTPVDVFVVQYNVARILDGDLAPTVQMSVHPIRAEGLLLLPPLLDAPDPAIREGIRAMLAEQLARQQGRPRQTHWTRSQIAGQLLERKLRGLRARLSEYQDSQRRERALKTFHEYVYQWY